MAGRACTTVNEGEERRRRAFPSSAPRNREAKNRPPRKPEPMLMAEAADFSRISSAMCVML